MTGNKQYRSDAEPLRRGSSPSFYASGKCIGLNLGSAAILAVKPFDPGEDDLIKWAHHSGFVYTSRVICIESGHDIIFCHTNATYH